MHHRLRSFLRAHVDTEITIKRRDYSLTGIVANISLGGLFVKSKDQLPAKTGDIYKIKFVLPFSSEDISLSVNGMAVRISPEGVAFRFIETDPKILRVLFDFIFP
ncbi:MAG: PilZ domain-containing protein [Desulfuromonadaceae bacterium]